MLSSLTQHLVGVAAFAVAFAVAFEINFFILFSLVGAQLLFFAFRPASGGSPFFDSCGSFCVSYCAEYSGGAPKV